MAIILPGNVASATADTGFDVDNSCRFSRPAAQYMHKTPGSDGNTGHKKYTFSTWVKRTSTKAVEHVLFRTKDGSNVENVMRWDTDGKLRLYATGGAASLVTSGYYRDPSAWYNIIWACDTTQGVAANRVKLYVNGTQVTAFGTETYPSADVDMKICGTTLHILGAVWTDSRDGDADFYLAETILIDGTQYAASDFGEFDDSSPKMWKPKESVKDLTFGTNGFYLDYKDSANLGNDINGGTDLTEVNLAAINQTTDSPTNSFATMNVINYSPSTNFTNTSESQDGALLFKQIAGTTADRRWVSTIGVTSGKWYFEAICTAGETNAYVGISDQAQYRSYGDDYVGELSLDVGYNLAAGSVYVNGSTVDTSEDTFGTSDIICVALDATNGKIYFRKNGGSWVNSGDPAGDSNGYDIVAGATYHPSGSISINNGSMRVNFGNPIVANASSVADGNGYGAFEYTPPSGFLALCTKNLGSDGG